MKIQEVTIEGYQSHTNSTFCLSPGLTVITGPSDAGKTAIIRALRWFAFNEPTGEAFLHTIRNPDGSVKEAVDQVKVSVTFDNGITITKTRRKGKTTYTHSAFPTAWEKAEIPPEIKETLGLVKQQYGDFETCLNFAFQLDAPFMLSESASVGAKVLGKLAGTEIVDKSISEVNKKTHQTRNDISYADKQIGEIDVSLTEYFDLDRFDAELKVAEAAFTKLKEDQSRHVALTALMNGGLTRYIWKVASGKRQAEALAADYGTECKYDGKARRWKVKTLQYTEEEFKKWQVTKKKRQEILDQCREGKVNILFATQLAREGLDIPSLCVGHTVTPKRGDGKRNTGINLEQEIGRIMRKDPQNPDKKAVWFDYVDASVGVLKGQYYSRRKVYKRLGIKLPSKPKSAEKDVIDGLLDSIKF